jgi:pacifastin inhibitor LCMII
MADVGYFRAMGWCAVAVPLLLACGGSVVTPPGSGGGPSGGGATGGANGVSGGSSAGVAGTSCAYQGKTYAEGARFPAEDGCNSCACQAGSISCTQIGCTPVCQSGGQSYKPGQSFKVDCNTCTCQAGGGLTCTAIACQDQCSRLQDQYAAALSKAKSCDPLQPNQCTMQVSSRVDCGCSTPVNASNTPALNELSKLSQNLPPACISPCPPCLSPGPATCTPGGTCENAPYRPVETACKVAGVVYPSGATGIPDPVSCNKCSCENGQLSCTEINCPSACPMGTIYAVECAQCGPTDDCEVAEYGCLPTCTDACMSGMCVNGVCRQLCG